MSQKIAKSTCTKCHGIFPRTEMKQVTIEENSGSSFGISTNPSPKRKNSTRLSGRSYTRKRKVWICNTCMKSEGGVIGKAFKGFFQLILFIIIMSVLYSVFVLN